MPITKYQNYMDVAQVGQIATLENTNIKTRSAEQIIEFGRALVRGNTPSVSVKNIYKSKASILFSADFVTSNTINLDVNGVSISEVVFTSSHNITFNNLIDSIDALTGVTAVAGTGDEVIITIDNSLSNIKIDNLSITGGASQAANIITYSSSDKFEGVAVLRHGQPIVIGGDDKYQPKDDVNVLTKGVVYVEVVNNVNYGDPVYVYNDKTNEANQGQFTNDPTGNLQVVTGKFLSSAIATISQPALAKIEINQP